jgi:hypothetical protein
MAGIITASNISGSLDAKNIALGVQKKMIELSNLAELCGKAEVPELTATIPVQSVMAGTEDLREMEGADIEGSDFTYVSFDLKKDRIKVARSDESRFKSRAGDPLALQIDAAAMRLAAILDKKVVTAMQTSPQTASTAAIWSTATNNPMVDIARAVAAVRPYKADFIIMPSAVWAKYVSNDYTKNYWTGNPDAASQAVATIPGLGLKVYINENVTAKSCLIGASNIGAVLGQGPIVTRDWDDPKGAHIYQIDNFRQVVAPIMKNSSSLNMAVYQTTAVIA